MRTWVQWLLILIFGGFFLLASLSKLADPSAFAADIFRYKIVGGSGAVFLALWLPWLEIMGAISLVMPRLRLAAAWLLMGLLGVFEVALLSAFFRGLNIDCGCLGAIAETGVVFAFTRNLFLLAGLYGIVRIEGKGE